MQHDPEFEEALAHCLFDVLQGKEPDYLNSSGQNRDRARLLKAALQEAVELLPPSITPGSTGSGSLVSRIGPYLIEAPIGEGGSAVVFRARRSDLDRAVALKVLSKPFSLIETFRTRFAREAQALARVRHDSVVTVHDVGTAEGAPYIAMELMEGGSLEDILSSLRTLHLGAARIRGLDLFPGPGEFEAKIARLLAMVADGLEELHNRGIVHRDLKPSNLLLDTRGRLVVGDLGLARHVDSRPVTRTGVILGTSQYLAPELTNSNGEGSEASDVFALGVTLYECLTLRPPFRGDTEEALFREIRDRDPDPPRSINRYVSKDLEAVCLMALKKGSHQRYASAAQMADDLRAAADGTPVRARLPSKSRRLLRSVWYHRVRVSFWLGVASIPVIAILAGAIYLRANREQRIEEWRSRFLRGTLLIMDEMEPEPAVRRERRLREALDAFRECTELLPERPEAWLRRAYLSTRLIEKDEGWSALRRARNLGGDGLLSSFIETLLSGERINAESLKPYLTEPPKRDPHDLPPWDRMALAEEMFRQGHLRKALEIASDPRLIREEILSAELLVATILHAQALPTINAEDDVCWDELESKARRAYLTYDGFLDRVESDLTSFNLALLVRDSLARDYNLGENQNELLARIEPIFASLLEETDRSLVALGHWLRFLWVSREFAEVTRVMDEIELRRFGELEMAAQWVFLQNLVINERYQEAFEVSHILGALKAEGPLRRVVQVYIELEDRYELRLEKLDAFVEDKLGEIRRADRNATRRAMVELRQGEEP